MMWSMEGEQKLEQQPELIITDASPDDALAYRELERNVWRQVYVNERTGITDKDIDWYFDEFKHAFKPEMLEKFQEELGGLDATQKAIVVKDGDNVIGTAWLMRGEDHNELGSIYLDPSVQGRGIGKRVWESALQYFDPTKPTIVTVNKQNESAIGYYQSLGFVEESELKSELQFPSGAEYQEIRMVRPPGSPEP
jgi:ribosomal protein S18 acetylase RimI-like enzyme